MSLVLCTRLFDIGHHLGNLGLKAILSLFFHLVEFGLPVLVFSKAGHRSTKRSLEKNVRGRIKLHPLSRESKRKKIGVRGFFDFNFRVLCRMLSRRKTDDHQTNTYLICRMQVVFINGPQSPSRIGPNQQAQALVKRTLEQGRTPKRWQQEQR